MGGEVRAELMSEKLGKDSWTKRLLKYVFARCGNCPRRLICWSRLFRDKARLAVEYRNAFDCEGNIPTNNPVGSFDAVQTIALMENCAGCDKLDTCVKDVIQSGEFPALVAATGTDLKKHEATIKKCAACPSRLPCWTGRLKRLGFDWRSKATAGKILLACVFVKPTVKEDKK
jgi:hypothetical protein